jgi:small multidrug resistance family-3 protein
LRELAFLILAALLEVGGDAFIRWGLKGGRILGFIMGAVVLFAYGVIVNTPKWDLYRHLLYRVSICFDSRFR